MQSLHLQVNGKPLIFTEQSVLYEGKEFFYNQMSNISLRSEEPPALLFDYDNLHLALPYSPGDQDVVMSVFQQIVSLEKLRKDAAPPEAQSKKTSFSQNAGGPVSDSAKIKKPIRKRWWLAVLFIALFLIIGIGVYRTFCADPPASTKETTTAATAQTSEEKKEDALKIKPNDLLKEYEENEEKGDELYKGKKLRLSGSVDEIGKDITEEVYVILQTTDQYPIATVQCFFSDDREIEKASKLKPNQKVTILGRCDGKFGNVIIVDCEILENRM